MYSKIIGENGPKVMIEESTLKTGFHVSEDYLSRMENWGTKNMNELNLQRSHVLVGPLHVFEQRSKLSSVPGISTIWTFFVKKLNAYEQSISLSPSPIQKINAYVYATYGALLTGLSVVIPVKVFILHDLVSMWNKVGLTLVTPLFFTSGVLFLLTNLKKLKIWRENKGRDQEQ